MEPSRKIEEFLRRWRSQYEGNGVFRVLVVTVVLAAYAVTSAGLQQTPTYEASALVWVGWEQGDQQTYVTRSGEEIQTLPPGGEGLQAIILTMIHAIDSRPVAKEAIQRLNLDMTPAELLDNLTIEQVENISFILISYEGTDPVRAKQIANTAGEVSSELISERSAAQQPINGHRVGEGDNTRKPGKSQPLEERAPYAGDRAGAVRGDRCCPAGHPRKGRRHTWRTVLPPRDRPSAGTRQGPQHSRAR